MAAVILVEPENAGNIGAVCRTMMNMNAGPLILVNPQADPFDSEAYRFALHASRLLEESVIATDLISALEDCDLSIAVTRRNGQYRKRDFNPESLGNYLASRPDIDARLIFGRESIGLTTEEVRQCDAVCGIPSHSAYPSLNLSHAVTVVLYEIYRHKNSPKEQNEALADPKEIREMLQSIEQCFVESDLFKKRSPENLMKYLEKFFLRRNPERYESLVISNAFKRLRGKIRGLKKESKKFDKGKNSR